MKVAIYTRKDKTAVYEIPQYLWDVYCLYQSTFGRKYGTFDRFKRVLKDRGVEIELVETLHQPFYNGSKIEFVCLDEIIN